jgi:hypothetical protein
MNMQTNHSAGYLKTLPESVLLILIQNGYMSVPMATASAISAITADFKASDYTQALGTVLSNMASYGFAPSKAALTKIMDLSILELESFWGALQHQLDVVTGADRKMEDHVVYKNFPREVLDMEASEYWIKQILMYIGLPNVFFVQDEEDRAPIADEEKLLSSLKVLDLIDESTFDNLYMSLQLSGASWRPEQITAMHEIISDDASISIDIGKFQHRDNGVTIAAYAIRHGLPNAIKTTSATDVLRIAADLSDAPNGIRTAPKFAKFSKSDRRMFTQLLEGCTDLENDFGLRREIWKRFLSRIHPGDFKSVRVNAAYADLYDGSKGRFNAKLEAGFKDSDPRVLELLKTEPGVFTRNLHRAYTHFGAPAFDAFKVVMGSLTNEQLLKLKCYLLTAKDRETFIARPAGKWSKLTILPNAKTDIEPDHAFDLIDDISTLIADRVATVLPGGVNLDPALRDVKLITNDQELAPYGRGTVFDIPEEMTFIRSASFWANKSFGNTWFDNGWNFYAEDWAPVTSCTWDKPQFASLDQSDAERSALAAVFSGDPTNSKDLEGRGCQMIDLYIDELAKSGVRYAVWSVLCYSHICFSDAQEVLATLQWGKDAETGKLYEPARAQMVFPLKGKEMSKFVAYIDVVDRKLVYMDLDLNVSVSSANNNLERIADLMPAFVDYTKSLPSIWDLFSGATQGRTQVLRSDEDTAVEGFGFVYDRRNETNEFTQIELAPLLSMK